MSKVLFIDLDICSQCEDCLVKCSYPYHPENNGVLNIREEATFLLICRRCEEPYCVLSCPKEALEKQKDGTLKRYTARCVGCGSCSLACPFGTILPDVIPFLISRCDLCQGRSNGKPPLCVETCSRGALKWGEFKADEEKHIYLLKEGILVKSTPWKKE